MLPVRPPSTPKRRRALLVAGLLAVAGCGGDAGSPVLPARGRLRPPGVVLIVVDTLRADAVPLDDAEPALLPSLRSFRRTATAFSDAIASAAWTPQSMPSLLTGLTPQHTGCQGMAETHVPELPGGVVTLAERLRALGYATTALTGGGYLSGGGGLTQGFDVFDPGFDVVGPEPCLWTWSRRHPAGVPFFLLLHTYAPHDPYGTKDPRAIASMGPSGVPPSPTLLRTLGSRAATVPLVLDPRTVRECAFEWFLDGRARPANARLVLSGDGADLVDSLQRWQDGGYLADPDGRAPIEERLRTAYQEGLRLADDLLRRTFSALDAAKLPPDTIVIVTSDHGEAHGEHGYLFHERRLHDEIVRVPLLIRAPGRMPEGAVIRGTCGPVDLAPTILELVGAAPERGIDGRSLVAQANREEGGHPVVSTADRTETVGDRRRPVRELRVRDDPWIWSYVFDVETGEVVSEHVFDLVTDPRALDPRPMGPFIRVDPERCRLVTAVRDETRRRFGLPLTDSPCARPR